MLTRIILAAVLALPAASFGAPPWEKTPEKWDRADAYRILQDSPWSPAQVKLETKSTYDYTDRETGRVNDSAADVDRTHPIRGIELSRSKSLPPIPVRWWSSKMVRLAQQRLQQLRNPGKAGQPLDAPSLPDYVVAIEGAEPQRIFSDAVEDLHDTVFLELPQGATLDLESVRFVEATDDLDARPEST